MPAQPPPGAAEYTLSENRQRSESPRRESVEIHFPPQSESEYQDSQNGWPYPGLRSASFLRSSSSAPFWDLRRFPVSAPRHGIAAFSFFPCILCTAAPLHDPFFRQNFPLFTIPSDFLCFVFIFSSEKLYLMYTFWSQFFRILISSTTKETNTNLHRFSINFNQETAKHPWKHVSNANLSNR